MSALLGVALGTSAEGLVGYWDGTGIVPAPAASDLDERLNALQPDARAAAVMQDGAGLLTVTEGVGVTEVSAGDMSVSLRRPDPKAELAAEGLTHIRDAMDLRADRLEEILVQQGDMTSFFGLLMKLDGFGNRWIGDALGIAYDLAVPVEMLMKFHLQVPRPIDFTPRIQPIIQTPSHGSCPSGHATEAYLFATVLALLKAKAMWPQDDACATVLAAMVVGPKDGKAKPGQVSGEMQTFTKDVTLLFELAARIADNRTVAGVHFPVDSAQGALLGLGLGLAMADPLLGEQCMFKAVIPKTDKAAWKGPFSQAAWLKWINEDLNLTVDESTAAPDRSPLIREIGRRAVRSLNPAVTALSVPKAAG
ncbi:MAG: phosphatase PAP2 family protein [Pseudomonadota bacterium]